MTWAAIMSLALIVNLPGLAISPMLDNLKSIFPHVSDLEIQLLTLLPNVFIIPFVLLSGELSMSAHRVGIVVAGLLIFGFSTIAYLFATTMTQLIVISCAMGAGAGLIIPFSTGFLSDSYGEPALMKQLGIQSGISNLVLVAATFIAGWLATMKDWHMPFLVYTLGIIPVILIPWLRGIPRPSHDPSSQNDATTPTCDDEFIDKVRFRSNGFSLARTIVLFALYFAVTALTIVISYYAPFLFEQRHWDESMTGAATSVYFLFIFLPGFILPWILMICKNSTSFLSMLAIVLGLALIVFIPTKTTAFIGSALCGIGYGVFQPLIYDKSTQIVNTPAKHTLAMSVILSSNYIGIVCAPLIIDSTRWLLTDGGQSETFPFVMNFIIAVGLLFTTVIFRRHFCYYIPKDYYDGSRK